MAQQTSKMKYLIFLIIICSSCSVFSPDKRADRKLRKAEKLIKQAEQLGATWGSDTVYKEIPIIIDSVRVDSIFVAQVGDTVFLEKDKLRITYVRLPGDSVYIEAESKADTVFQKVPVTVIKTIQAKTNWWLYFFVGFGACLLVVVVVGKLRS